MVRTRLAPGTAAEDIRHSATVWMVEAHVSQRHSHPRSTLRDGAVGANSSNEAVPAWLEISPRREYDS